MIGLIILGILQIAIIAGITIVIILQYQIQKMASTFPPEAQEKLDEIHRYFMKREDEIEIHSWNDNGHHEGEL